MQFAVAPRIAQRIRRHRDGRKGRRWLRLEEAEALFQLGRDEIAQADIVHEHDEANAFAVPQSALIPASQSSTIDRDFGFEIATPGLVSQRNRFHAWPRKASLPPWYISGSVQNALRHLGAARLAHQRDVVHIRRPVSPLIRTRQRRCGFALVEALAQNRTSVHAFGDSERRRGSACAQSSSAACIVGTSGPACAHQARSSETTTSLPSRPWRSDASFMISPNMDRRRPRRRAQAQKWSAALRAACAAAARPYFY
jgi:hypothetical protein